MKRDHEFWLLSSSTNIRGYQVYIPVWNTEKGDKLHCHKDDRDDVSVYDNHVIGIYKQKRDFTLVGHVPM